MKKNTLEKVLQVLEEEINEVILDKDIIEKAIKPLERMLSLS